MQALNIEFNRVTDWSLSADGDSKNSNLRDIAARHLGPIIELGRSLAQQQERDIATVDFPTSTHTIVALQRALRSRNHTIIQRNMGAIGFASFADIDSNSSRDERAISFVERTVRACMDIGVARPLAQASAGAMEEMINNAMAHSLRPETTIAGFRVQQQLFEFAVADAGIGILDSLRQCSEFQDLEDEGDALQLAIADGVSRHGSKSGHGMGFRDIFNMPNNHRGHMWLHSGDSALVIGEGLLASTESQVRQVNNVSGVLVSVAFQV